MLSSGKIISELSNFYLIPQDKPAIFGDFDISESEQLLRPDFYENEGKDMILNFYGYPTKAKFIKIENIEGSNYGINYFFILEGGEEYRNRNLPHVRLFKASDRSMNFTPFVEPDDWGHALGHPFSCWSSLVDRSKRLVDFLYERLKKNKKELNAFIALLELDKSKWLLFEQKYADFARKITGETLKEQKDRMALWQDAMPNKNKTPLSTHDSKNAKSKLEAKVKTFQTALKHAKGDWKTKLEAKIKTFQTALKYAK